MVEINESDGLENVPPELPLLPIRDLVVFPFMVVPLYVDREISQKAVEQAMSQDRLLFLASQRTSAIEAPMGADLYRVGSLGKLLRSRWLVDGRLKILVQGVRRAVIDQFVSERPALVVKASALADAEGNADSPTELEGLVRVVRESLQKLSEAGRGFPRDVSAVLSSLEDPGALADLVASNLALKVPDAQMILEAASPADRLRRLIELVSKEVEVASWQQKIQDQAKEEMSRIQRDYFLRQQLKQIRSELGDLDAKVEELEDLRSRIELQRLPREAEQETRKQLRRLEQMNPDAAEAAVVRSYLDVIADLPWQKESEDLLDLDYAEQILDEEHHGLMPVKDRILEYLGVLKLKRDHKGPILCFVGPPGVGKTSLGRSIARALGRAFVRMSLGGVHDESEIRGHRRTYVGAMPGRILAGLKQAGTKNPVFVLDELDKLGREGRGDPSAALLEVLDPEQNATFRDHYLNLPFDLSRVLWVATANLVDAIPPPLRDRMELIHLPGYHLDEKLSIARRFLVPRQRERCGLSNRDLAFTQRALETMVEGYTREAGVRGLEQQIAKVTRKIARRLAEGKAGENRVTSRSVRRYLGPRKHDPERPDASDAVGLATGLAWTEAGGAILHIEAVALAGKPELTLTGQLGKVMRESAQAALSCARAKADSLGISDRFFREHEFHLHVPQGAIPKDGPSAGITMASALMSLLTGCPVRRDVAMTGEITLRGRVLSVGGLREKILAAVRAGMAEVVVPEANSAELSEVPALLRERVVIHRVRQIEQVFEIALVGFAERCRVAPFPSEAIA